MVVSAQHPKLMELVTKEKKSELEKFLKRLKSVSEKEQAELEKEGVFTGSYAINPANNEKVPVYAGNFVVADYGSGMVMAVPAHDQRDFEFAKKYGIKIKQVISGKLTEDRAWTEEGNLMNSGKFNGIKNTSAIEEITKYLESKKLARKVVNYKLRDWSVARQRYWGTPIPLIHCEKCGIVPVPEKDLPVGLPKDVKFGGGNPLVTNEKWLNVKCPKCNGKAKREANTLDTFVNSSWYFLRFCDPKNEKEIFDKKKVKYWMPIDLYIGGAEHACMHLIYCRFYTMFLKDLGLINFDEPSPRLFHQGMINDEKGEKMSKSKGNVIEPLETMAKYGVDTTRFFMMSEASPDKGFNWSDAGIQGSLRIIRKINTVSNNIKFGKDSQELLIKLNNSIKNITEQIENLDYRKSTIELRELFDLISKQEEISKESFGKALKLLAPFCPHIAEEIWQKIGNNRTGKDFISVAEWPEAEKVEMKKDKANLTDKIIFNVSEVLKRIETKQKVDKIYLYVMPFEIDKIEKGKIEKAFGKKTEVFSVSDNKKYDPQGMAKRAKPFFPGIYVE
jgi:leucyl-tRNA synthetase